MVAAVLASVIAYIDESVVNVALPAIAENLAASIAVIQWVINAYTLCLAASGSNLTGINFFSGELTAKRLSGTRKAR